MSADLLPAGTWNMTADGNTVCSIDECGHLEVARSGVLARQAAHERDMHALISTADRSGDG